LAMFVCTSYGVAQNCNNGDLVINQSFSKYNNQNREYTLNMLRSDFPRVSPRTSGEIRGIGGNWPQETRVINGELRAQYIRNAASGRKGGFLFDSSFPSTEEATLEYRVKFDKNFTWATGGKLPGLGGASSISGGLPAGCTQNQNTIQNAFSCRLMWRSNRAHTQKPYIIVYPYLPGRSTRCGGDIRVINDLKKDRWYTIKQYVKLNTPGRKNGILKMYVDGKVLVNLTNMEYRLPGKGNVKINSLIMHTYRGGNATDPVWWSPNTDYVYFDNVKVWTTCSGNSGGGGNPTSTTVQAENFTNMSGVRVADTGDVGGGKLVGWLNSGDWVAYRINVPRSGTYKIEYRIASLNGGGKISLEQNEGTTFLGTINVPSTGSWNNWRTISHTVTLNAGQQDIAIGIPEGGYNINWWKFTGPINSRIAVEEVQAAPLAVYPNPVVDFVQINSKEKGAVTINVLNNSGQAIISQSFAAGDAQKLDVRGIPNGLYVVQVVGAEGMATHRFVKTQ